MVPFRASVGVVAIGLVGYVDTTKGIVARVIGTGVIVVAGVLIGDMEAAFNFVARVIGADVSIIAIQCKSRGANTGLTFVCYRALVAIFAGEILVVRDQ